VRGTHGSAGMPGRELLSVYIHSVKPDVQIVSQNSRISFVAKLVFDTFHLSSMCPSLSDRKICYPIPQDRPVGSVHFLFRSVEDVCVHQDRGRRVPSFNTRARKKPWFHDWIGFYAFS
jgi:hypothetical protein